MDLAASYLAQLQALLPEGAAWTREDAASLTAVLAALADGFARVHARAETLQDEIDPRTSFELLGDWERVTGLPDPCATAAGLGFTLQERRAAVVTRLTATGGQASGYFAALITALGYTATITEFRPFVCGQNRCGDQVNGGHNVRFYWRVTISGARVTRFRTGASQCGDRLATYARAEDLECLLNRLRPAHTTLTVGYEGV